MRGRAVIALPLAMVAACDEGGGGWRAYSTPDIGAVTALWAFAPDDVWAGGARAWHRDGAAFTEIASPATAAEPIADFWGFAPDDLYAVGGAQLLHWDGAAWSRVDFGGAIEPGNLTTIWGSSRDDLWLGDALDGSVFHWDGAAWSIGASGTVMINDLWGVAGGPVFAGGASGLSRWNSSAWDPINTDGVVGQASGLWGFGPDDVWSTSAWGTLAHWNGTIWTDRRPLDEAFVDVNHALWGAGPDDLWVVGDQGAIAHWDGVAWTQDRTGPLRSLVKVHGSSASDVWAAGRDSDAADTGVGGGGGIILHYEP